MTADEIARLRESAESYIMACEVGEPWRGDSARNHFIQTADPETFLRLLDERDALLAYVATNEEWDAGDEDTPEGQRFAAARDRLRDLGLIGGDQ